MAIVGHGSNFDYAAYLEEDNTGFPYRAGIASIVLVTVTYALRFWARYLQIAPWGWYDGLMIPGFISNVGMGICGILAAEWGAGRHLEFLMLGSPSVFAKWGVLSFYIAAVIYYAAVTLPRISIIVLYLQLFSDRCSRYLSWAVIVILVGRAFGETLLLFLQCDQLQYAWQIENWAGHCTTLEVHYTYGRIPNMAADVVMLVIPIPTLWRLQLDLGVKLGIIATFSVASFGLLTAILGFVSFYQSAFSFDISWHSGSMIAWSVLESAVYFSSACMLTYRPLLRQLMRRKRPESSVISYPTVGGHRGVLDEHAGTNLIDRTNHQIGVLSTSQMELSYSI